MKRVILIGLVVVAGAFVLLRPLPPPAPAAPGWSSQSRPPRARDRATPTAQALVYVAGEVTRPGVYPVGADARVRDALKLAGGMRAGADLLAVNLAAHVRDGDEIAVPLVGAAPLRPTHRGHGRSPRTRGPRSPSAHGKRRSGDAGPRDRRSRRGDALAPASPVDINTADAETLASIPGIGDGLAKRIVQFRDQNGAFASVDELLDVAGITEHRLDAMIPYVVAL